MKAFLQPPLVFFVIAGVGCAILATTGLLDSFRTFLKARGADPQDLEKPKLGFRFAGGVAMSGLLGFLALYLLSTVVAMAPRMLQAFDLVGDSAPELSYARFDRRGRCPHGISRVAARRCRAAEPLGYLVSSVPQGDA